MQSTQDQYRQVFAHAHYNFLVTLEELKTEIGSQLFPNTTPMQIDATIISSQLASIRASNKNLLDTIKALEDLWIISANAKKAMSEMDRTFRAMELYLTLYLDRLKHIKERELGPLGTEEELSMFKRTFQSQFNELKTPAESAFRYIMEEIDENEEMDANDIEAILTQVVTQRQNRKRKAEHQSLGDESVPSRRRNDPQPVVAESAYEPDTMLSSATVSSAESSVRYQ